LGHGARSGRQRTTGQTMGQVIVHNWTVEQCALSFMYVYISQLFS